jgi:hypothetical protein
MEKSSPSKENQHKKIAKSHCCKSSENSKDTDKECCGEMCKCQHLNHNHIVSLMPLNNSCLALSNPLFVENIKFNKNNLHGFDPLTIILQPPRV